MNGFGEAFYNRYRQLLQYIIVGGTAFTVDLVSLYVLAEFLKIHYLISAAISFVIATGVNYILCVRWIFEGGKHSALNEILLIFIVSGIGLLLNELIIYFLVEFILIWYITAKLIAAGTVIFWNYSARKYYVFSK